uniref:Protein kinase domain-containing protein n=1 Tax=Caenorhabditis tropicalis TaxID=1561998 RepID=A0A1I7TL48_9PELO
MGSKNSTQPHSSTKGDDPGTSNSTTQEDSSQLVIKMTETEVPAEEYARGGFLRLNPGHFINDYQLVKYLGRGAFGTVWLTKHSEAGTYAAMKISRSNRKYRDFAQREINCLEGINFQGGHPNIVKLMETFITGQNRINHVVMLFEVLGPNLESVIFDSGKKLSVEVVKRVSRQLLEAINFINNRKIVHMDIKSANVMLAISENDIKNLASSQDSTCSRYDIDLTKADARIVAKLADFGHVLYTYENMTDMHPESNCLFRAPEQFLTTEFDTSLDMWSFGCMLYEMVSGSFLFPCKEYTFIPEHDFIHFMLMAHRFGPIRLADFEDGLRPRFLENFNPDGNINVEVMDESLPTFFQMAQQKGWSDEDAEEYSSFLLLFFKYNRGERITAGDALHHDFIRSNGARRDVRGEDAPVVPPLSLNHPEAEIEEEFDRVAQNPDAEEN